MYGEETYTRRNRKSESSLPRSLTPHLYLSLLSIYKEKPLLPPTSLPHPLFLHCSALVLSVEERERKGGCMPHRAKRCPTMIMFTRGMRRRVASMLACSPCAAASAAMRPVSAAWMCSAAAANTCKAPSN